MMLFYSGEASLIYDDLEHCIDVEPVEDEIVPDDEEISGKHHYAPDFIIIEADESDGSVSEDAEQ